jgi:hypothetical protein
MTLRPRTRAARAPRTTARAKNPPSAELAPAALTTTAADVPRSERDSLGPPPLSDEDRAVLSEAIDRAAALQEAIEQSWTDFGRWVFSRVFGEDTTSAIDHREDNPIWAALMPDRLTKIAA